MCCALGSYGVETPPGSVGEASADPSAAPIRTCRLESQQGIRILPQHCRKHLQMKENAYLLEAA